MSTSIQNCSSLVWRYQREVNLANRHCLCDTTLFFSVDSLWELARWWKETVQHSSYEEPYLRISYNRARAPIEWWTYRRLHGSKSGISFGCSTIFVSKDNNSQLDNLSRESLLCFMYLKYFLQNSRFDAKIFFQPTMHWTSMHRDPHHTGTPSPAPLLVTSGGQDWGPVQTCSLADTSNIIPGIWWQI